MPIHNKTTRDLSNEDGSRIFYEDRFEKGYMEDWPMDKKLRVYEIVKELDLPEYGDALDYGCGNGVLTAIIKEALPKWNVYGFDISQRAIENASARFGNCIFFTNGGQNNIDRQYDLIFTHHVLEHVYDVRKVAFDINDWAKKKSAMLHILPCGNPNSFEYNLCKLRADGIDKDAGNRYFFEDEGHVRRMTTRECAGLFEEFNFKLSRDYYANQYYGAWNWITCSGLRIIPTMFNPIKGKCIKSKIKLMMMLIESIALATMRMPGVWYRKHSRKDNLKMKHMVYRALLWLPSRMSKYIDRIMESLTAREWKERRAHNNGSEMYLYLRRVDEPGH